MWRFFLVLVFLAGLPPLAAQTRDESLSLEELEADFSVEELEEAEEAHTGLVDSKEVFAVGAGLFALGQGRSLRLNKLIQDFLRNEDLKKLHSMLIEEKQLRAYVEATKDAPPQTQPAQVRLGREAARELKSLAPQLERFRNQYPQEASLPLDKLRERIELREANFNQLFRKISKTNTLHPTSLIRERARRWARRGKVGGALAVAAAIGVELKNRWDEGDLDFIKEDLVYRSLYHEFMAEQWQLKFVDNAAESR